MDLSAIVDFFNGKHFNAFYKWAREALGFYVSPKTFVLDFEKKQNKEFVRSLFKYFLFFEFVILLFACSLLDVLHFEIYKVFGFLLGDLVFTIPLIGITALSLFVAKIKSPLKKAIAFILLFKVFLILPFQIFLILFLFFEDYTFLAIFLILAQSVVVANLVLPAFFFASKPIKKLLVISTAIVLFIALTLFSIFNPLTPNKNDEGIPLDPIYSEFEHLKAKAILINQIDLKMEIESLKQYKSLILEGNFYDNVDSLKDDWKYRNEIILNKVRSEKEFFIDKNAYRFRTNRLRFAKYLEFLEALLQCQEACFRSLDILKLEMANKTIEMEMAKIDEEIRQLKEKKPASSAKIRQQVPSGMWPEIEKEHMWPVIEKKLREIEKQELKSNVLILEISKEEKRGLTMKNAIKSLEIEGEYYRLATEVEMKMVAFIEEENKYMDLLIRVNALILL